MRILNNWVTASKERLEPWAKSILNLSNSEWYYIKQIRKKGVEKFSLNILDLKRKQLLLIETWEKSTFPQKIDHLLSSKETYNSIWTFLLKVINRYKNLKKNRKNTWKKRSTQVHLLRIKELVDRSLENSKLTQEDAEEITVKLYYTRFLTENQ